MWADLISIVLFLINSFISCRFNTVKFFRNFQNICTINFNINFGFFIKNNIQLRRWFCIKTFIYVRVKWFAWFIVNLRLEELHVQSLGEKLYFLNSFLFKPNEFHFSHDSYHTYLRTMVTKMFIFFSLWWIIFLWIKSKILFFWN